MAKENKPAAPREGLRPFSTEGAPSKTRRVGGKATGPVVPEVCTTTSHFPEKNPSLPITFDGGKTVDQARDSVMSPTVATASTELPEARKDDAVPPASTVGEKSIRTQRRRSSVKTRRSSEDRDVAIGRSRTGRSKRRKQKPAEAEADPHGTEENVPRQLPPAPTSEAENEPTSKQERSVWQASEPKPTEVTVSVGVDGGKLDDENADDKHHVRPQPSTSSASTEGNRQAENDKIGEKGAKETDRNCFDDVDADARHESGPDKAGEDANVQGKAEEDTEDRLKEERPETGKLGKCGRMLKRVSCVSFHSPEDEERDSRGTGTAVTRTPSRQRSRSGIRKSDGDLRSLYSVVALKDLATTLRVESVERARPPRRHMAGLLKAQYRVLVTVVTLVSIVVAFTVALWISTRFLPTARGACGSVACAELSAAFDGVLNYSVNPCDDLDAFVCSKGPRSGSGFDAGSRSSVAHHIKEYRLAMVELLLGDETTTFTASRVVTNFLRECTDDSDAATSTDSVINFFDLASIPWPFRHSNASERHPLEGALTLSLVWGIDTWFRAYLHTADFSGTPALFIEVAAQASTWLDFVRTLEEVGSREKYFQLFHDRYDETLPAPGSVELRLATEKDVLSTLDAVRSSGTPERPVIARLAKIPAHVRNCTVDNWLTPVAKASDGSTVDEKTVVSVEDVRILRAIDLILSKYNAGDLMQHLSWWLLQILIVIGSPQDYVLIAGSHEFAVKEVNMECYKLVASRFGLLLASESAVGFFTRDSRRDVEVFLRGLLDMLGGLAANANRLSDKVKVATARRIQDLDVALWPLKVDGSNKTLWQLYENFQRVDSLNSTRAAESETNATSRRAIVMDYWLHANSMYWGLTSEQRDLMQLQWQEDALDSFRYEPLTNRLRVSHALLRSPFYYPASDEVLAANLGGLGAFFLTHVLQMFVAPVVDTDPGVSLSTWPEVMDIAALTHSPNCSAAILPNVRDVFALALAWHALQTAADTFTEGDRKSAAQETHLAIRDERNVKHFYSEDQLFFLSYCRSRCAGRRRVGSPSGTDCNAAVRSIADFSRTFNCTRGSPMVPLNACHVSGFA